MKEPNNQAKPLHQPQDRSTCEHIDLLDEKHILEPTHKSKQKLSASDNKTKAHFFNYIKKEWNSEKRVSTSIRVNRELYLEFKKVSKALYGSTCRAVEAFMASTVLAAREKAFFCHTVSQPVPIQIGEIYIGRNLRPRRSLPLQDCEMVEEEPQEVAPQHRAKQPESCFYCDLAPVWRCETVFKGSPIMFLCNHHLSALSRRSEILSQERLVC